MMTATDIKGVYAIIPTPAIDTGDRWSESNSVDLVETSRAINQLIADGVDGLITTGTTGECATLLPEEYAAFVECAVKAVDQRIPLFCGAGSLGTRQTIRMVKLVRDAGADGCMVGLPMWQPATVDVAVGFYQDVAEAVPDFPLMVYANSMAFRFNYPPPFWQRVSNIPSLIAAKYSDLSMYVDVLSASEQRINFLPIDARWYMFARLSPEQATACWSTASAMGPAPVLALRDAIRHQDWERAYALHEEIGAAGGTIRTTPGGIQNFPSWNIQLEKTRMNAAGYIKAGPIRPPYHAFKESDLAGAVEVGHRWRALHEKYAGALAGAR